MKNTVENFPKPVVLKTAKGYNYFEYDDIILFRAVGHKAECLIVGHSVPFRIYHNLSYIQKKYNNIYFRRCNKATIINLKYIKNLEIKTRQLHLINNIVLKASDEFVSYLKNSLKGDDFANSEKNMKSNGSLYDRVKIGISNLRFKSKQNTLFKNE